MRFLITAIGSMAAECVIKELKKIGHFVVGCDIYPKEWHFESRLCDVFIQSPYASEENTYIKFLLENCKLYNLNYLIPLTDLEIDIIRRHRESFDEMGIILCMQNNKVLDIVRDKYLLYQRFITDNKVATIRTSLLKNIPDDFPFPCIAKPYNGRSSEGLIRNAKPIHLSTIENKDIYIVQEQIDGELFTIDYVRNSKSTNDVAIPRQELLRTKNGAGLTVKIRDDQKLIALVRHIGQALDINGCVNMEFIYSDGNYYLIDINPRFSAGIAFSVLSGYNMILNHIRCFTGDDIDLPIALTERILLKKYEEVFA